jgi:hypothetical protein
VSGSHIFCDRGRATSPLTSCETRAGLARSSRPDRGAAAVAARDDEAASTRREVHGQSCGGVVDALAVDTAIALRSDVAAATAPIVDIIPPPVERVGTGGDARSRRMWIQDGYGFSAKASADWSGAPSAVQRQHRPDGVMMLATSVRGVTRITFPFSAWMRHVSVIQARRSASSRARRRAARAPSASGPGLAQRSLTSWVHQAYPVRASNGSFWTAPRQAGN